jgi:alginate O-acetyltransferase complex protein AlgI
MVFSSHLFLFYFLPLVLALYYAAPRRGRHLILCVLSYAFYGWANPLFVVVMLTSTAIDYVCGLAMTGQLRRSWSDPVPLLERGGLRTAGQRIALIISICSNLSLLGFFKYFGFATESYDAVVSALGLPGLRLDLAFAVTLPLGISFYTFQSMSYSIDIFRGHARAIRNPVDFACYVSLFPQLVAGPIIRFHELDDQLRSRTHSVEKFARGVAFLALGLGKKVLLANPCGKVADLAFDAAGVGIADAWTGAGAYAFQIYFDFSGYSDMAIGLGLMLGFAFPKNFDSPYRSQSITEFWRRWHMSLSQWLRDYLYIPLGGNRNGAVRTYANLAVVMLLGGLWHGASWTFVIWGGIHGAMLCLERLHGKRGLYDRIPVLGRTPAFLRVAATFVILLVTWVFFRSDDLGSALRYCGSMIGLGDPPEGAGLIGGVMYQPYYVLTMCIAALITWTCPQTWNWTRRLTDWKAAAVFVVFALAVLALTTQAFNPFIYFIF